MLSGCESRYSATLHGPGLSMAHLLSHVISACHLIGQIATNGPLAAGGGLSLKAGSRLWCIVHLAECCLDLCVAVVVNNSTTGTSPLFYTCFSIYPHFLLPPLVFTQMSFFIQITNCAAPSSVKALAIARLYVFIDFIKLHKSNKQQKQTSL